VTKRRRAVALAQARPPRRRRAQPSDPQLNPQALDINKGKGQVAHGIVIVLRAADL